MKVQYLLHKIFQIKAKRKETFSHHLKYINVIEDYHNINLKLTNESFARISLVYHYDHIVIHL